MHARQAGIVEDDVGLRGAAERPDVSRADVNSTSLKTNNPQTLDSVRSRHAAPPARP